MSVSFSIKNVPDEMADVLRARARRNHRSLQGELLALLEAATGRTATEPAGVRETAPPLGVEPTPGLPAAPPPPRTSSQSSPARPFSVDRDKLGDICRHYHVRRLSIFGSVLRPDFGPESDVDFLAEFDEGHTLGFGIFRLEEELSALVDGRKVDVVNRKFLNARLAPVILASARVLYAEG